MAFETYFKKLSVEELVSKCKQINSDDTDKPTFSVYGYLHQNLRMFKYSPDNIKKIFMKIAEEKILFCSWFEKESFLNFLLENYKDNLTMPEWSDKIRFTYKIKNPNCNIVEDKPMTARFNGSLKEIIMNSQKDIPNFSDPGYQKTMDYMDQWGGNSIFKIFNMKRKQTYFVRKYYLQPPNVLFHLRSSYCGFLQIKNFMTSDDVTNYFKNIFKTFRENARRKIRMIFINYLAKQEFLRIFNHIRYRPNGNGYNEAKRDFEETQLNDIQIKT